MNAVTAKVAAAFDAAAGTYEQAAGIQREIAASLAARIRTLPLPHAPRILEIGCGTGFLTQTLADLGGDIVATDISEAMLRHCRTSAKRVVMNGEAPCLRGGFDLICSSLAFQWFGTLPAALTAYTALLNAGGYLAFAMLGEGTFAEWDAAISSARARTYPSRSDLQAMLPDASVEEQNLVRRYTSGQEFLRRLRQIGAHRAHPDDRPLPAGTLRKALRQFDNGIAVSYRVLFALAKKP
jgi:malonyl-CoA O-methyltransferase